MDAANMGIEHSGIARVSSHKLSVVSMIVGASRPSHGVKLSRWTLRKLVRWTPGGGQVSIANRHIGSVIIIGH